MLMCPGDSIMEECKHVIQNHSYMSHQHNFMDSLLNPGRHLSGVISAFIFPVVILRIAKSFFTYIIDSEREL